MYRVPLSTRMEGGPAVVLCHPLCAAVYTYLKCCRRPLESSNRRFDLVEPLLPRSPSLLPMAMAAAYLHLPTQVRAGGLDLPQAISRTPGRKKERTTRTGPAAAS